MTLTQLRYLIAIIDAGFNVTEAAARLNATQPGVSKQLKQLEDGLGFQLFVRRGRSLSGLSQGGAAVAERARVILAEAGDIRTLAGNHRGDQRGELRIVTTGREAAFGLPQTLVRLQAAHPGVALQLSLASRNDALRRLEQDEADVAIVSGPTRPEGSAVALPAYRWTLVALTPPGHPLADNPTVADLAGYPLVADDLGRQTDSAVGRAFAAADRVPDYACAADDAEMVKTWVRAGAGVGLVAEMAASDLGDLRARPLDGQFAPATTWIVLKRRRVLPSYVLDWLSDIAPHIGRRELRGVMDGAVERWAEPPTWREAQARLASGPAGAELATRRVVPFPTSAAAASPNPRAARS